MAAVSLSKQDARRALIAYQFAPGGVVQTIERLRSVQFDPLRPVGSNHDLVLQARVPGYRIGDWEPFAYDKRKLYDGWDKQACLIPYSGWPARRVFHKWRGGWLEQLERDHPHAVKAVLDELEQRGPLLPREFGFQERRDEWSGSWYGPNMTKNVLRALWHSGHVMTAGRRGQHHVYDLTNRVVPKRFLNAPPMGEEESLRAILRDRHQGVGLVRPSASPEVWSMSIGGAVLPAGRRMAAIRELVTAGDLVPIDVEGMSAHATPDFLRTLDSRRRPARVVFLGPLDQILWDRQMVNHVFGFDYVWEVYKPESERKWGYYVLPVLFGESFVARFEAWCREGVLEIRCWHWEGAGPPARGFWARAFWTALEAAAVRFAEYCGARTAVFLEDVDVRVAEAWRSALGGKPSI